MTRNNTSAEDSLECRQAETLRRIIRTEPGLVMSYLQEVAHQQSLHQSFELLSQAPPAPVLRVPSLSTAAL